MLNGFFAVLPIRVGACQKIAVSVLVGGLLVAGLGGGPVEAQHLRVDVGGGWAFPTNNLSLESEPVTVSTPDGTGEIPIQQDVDLNSGPHVYVGLGFVRSIGENFELGVRLRAHQTNLRSSVDCSFDSDCGEPSGTLRAGTIEGRVILTSLGWIDPYLLVGLGVVHTSVDGVTLRNVPDPVQEDTVPFSDVSIVDAGGDVGLGAAIPIVGGLALDAEFRVAGSLPGGKDNTVTVAPFTLGLAYNFE